MQLRDSFLYLAIEEVGIRQWFFRGHMATEESAELLKVLGFGAQVWANSHFGFKGGAQKLDNRPREKNGELKQERPQL